VLAAALAALLAAPAAAAGSLEERWLARVEISTAATPAQRARLTGALKALLRSPTGRPRCRALLALPGRLEVGFYSHPETTMKDSGYGPALEGSVGATMRLEDPMRVVVDERLSAGPWGSIEETLAHEVLGHAALALETKRDGLLEAIVYYEDDELRAKLVGAVIGLELGRPQRDPDYEDAFATATFRAALYTGRATGLRLALEELPAAADRLRERLQGLPKLRRAAEGLLRGYEIWRWRIAHLKEAHARDPSAFLDVEEALTTHERSKKSWLAAYDDARTLIEDTLTRLVPPDGPDVVALGAASRAGVPARLRRDVLALQRRLKRLWAKAKDPAPAPEAPRAAVQLDWAAIEELVNEDKKASPEHYADEPPAF
jgi:hypothetical protein